MYNIKKCILYEDQYMIVCRKPAGLPVQSARLGQMDMESMLKNYLSAVHPGEVPFLGIVHRLDQPVEGLLVFGKTKEMTADLNRLLSAGKLEKGYRAIVHGVPRETRGTFIDYLKKDARSNHSETVQDQKGGKRSVLTYRIVKKTETASLLEIHIDSGRHHQIRVQMSAHGLPLMGDHKYGKKDDVENVALCAHYLAFVHPKTGKKMEFKIKPEGLPDWNKIG